MNAYTRPGINIITKDDISSQDKIFKKVCECFGYEPEQVRKYDKLRIREFVVIRQVSMVMMRTYLKSTIDTSKPLSFAKCGAYFEKDHATAIHAHKTVLNLLDTDKHFRQLILPLFNYKRPKK